MSDLLTNVSPNSMENLDTSAWDPYRAAELLDADAVERAAKDCKTHDIWAYLGVSSDFGIMLRVLSANEAVPRMDADQSIAEHLNGFPVILRGNGGMGKTTLMMSQAIQWARGGGIAFWLRMDMLDAGQAASCVAEAARRARQGQKVLLCLESPYENQKALDVLRQAWLDSDVPAGPEAARNGGYVQLLMAERSSRLERLTARTNDRLRDWFDNAFVAELRSVDDIKPPRPLKDYAVSLVHEERNFRLQVLKKCTERYVEDGSISRNLWFKTLIDVRDRYDRPNVSIVELLYRALFHLKRGARRTSSIMMDWDEWSRGFERMPGNIYTPFQWYGGIAVFRLFGTAVKPLTLGLFCRRFHINAHDLAGWLRDWRTVRNVEPVIYRPVSPLRPESGTLAPKHDIIAELFFLFHMEDPVSDEAYAGDNPVDVALAEYLDVMGELEIEAFLDGIASKESLKEIDSQWQERELGRPNFWEYFTYIFDRTQKPADENGLRLSAHGMTTLCLGLLWAKAGERVPWSQDLQTMLEAAAPAVDDTLQTHILYTEWGICLNNAGRTDEAEAKFRTVVEVAPRHLQSRTELGRILSHKPGHEGEAEALFREIIAISAAMGKRDLQSRVELGRLLSRQRGREAEAEALFLEAIDIDRNNLHPHTELGKLLGRQPGREEEAVNFLQEAMDIFPDHIQSRMVLAGIRERQGRFSDAAALYREILDIKPGDRRASEALDKLERRK